MGGYDASPQGCRRLSDVVAFSAMRRLRRVGQTTALGAVQLLTLAILVAIPFAIVLTVAGRSLVAPDVAAADDGTTAVVLNAHSFGARGNGKHDDTAALRRALAAAAAEGATLTLPRGTYIVRSVTIPSGVTVTGDGPLKSWLRGKVTAASNVVLAELRIGRPGRAFHLAADAHDTLFRHCRFVGGGGMKSGQNQGVVRLDAHSAQRITFERCVIGRNSSNGNGVSIANGPWGHYEDILFENSCFCGQPRMDFECIQRGGEAFRNIDLVGCVFGASDSQTISYDGGGGLGGYSRVEGCMIKGAGRKKTAPWPHDFESNSCSGMVVTGNTFYSARGAMLNLTGNRGSGLTPGSSVSITGNTFTVSKGIRHRLSACYASLDRGGILISGNHIKVGRGSELFYVDGPDNALTDNTIRIVRNISLISVFWLADAPRTIVSGNSVRAFGRHVFVRSGAGGSSFTENTFVTGLTAAKLFVIQRGVQVTVSGNSYD
jgi:hypothetical protein